MLKCHLPIVAGSTFTSTAIFKDGLLVVDKNYLLPRVYYNGTDTGRYTTKMTDIRLTTAFGELYRVPSKTLTERGQNI